MKTFLSLLFLIGTIALVAAVYAPPPDKPDKPNCSKDTVQKSIAFFQLDTNAVELSPHDSVTIDNKCDKTEIQPKFCVLNHFFIQPKQYPYSMADSSSFILLNWNTNKLSYKNQNSYKVFSNSSGGLSRLC
ncbi:MAG TPA: hypothetical protein DCS19_11320 [Flavobacterium sp.]|nr:hypothetical protein [Flavobacterium sp.]